jgi:hypothetical protein
MSLSVCLLGRFEAMDRPQAIRRGDWVMRPGYCVQGARQQSHAHCILFFARACTPKPHAHGPVAKPGFTYDLEFWDGALSLNRTRLAGYLEPWHRDCMSLTGFYNNARTL